MGLAFVVSEEEVQAAFKRLGMLIDNQESSAILAEITPSRAEKAALHGADLDQQAEYAVRDIRDQLVELGHNDHDVAEWVGQHYRKNFDAETGESKAEWRKRYVESLQEADRLK